MTIVDLFTVDPLSADQPWSTIVSRVRVFRQSEANTAIFSRDRMSQLPHDAMVVRVRHRDLLVVLSGSPVLPRRSRLAVMDDLLASVDLCSCRGRRPLRWSVERCQSGRMGRPAKALWCKPPWVRIPSSPPNRRLIGSARQAAVSCLSFVARWPRSGGRPSLRPMVSVDGRVSPHGLARWNCVTNMSQL